MKTRWRIQWSGSVTGVTEFECEAADEGEAMRKFERKHSLSDVLDDSYTDDLEVFGASMVKSNDSSF